jgi:hypothetical protein
MNTLRTFLIPAFVLWIACTTRPCQGQGKTAISFDGPPIIAPGAAIQFWEYYEAGVWVRPLGVVGPGNGFGRRGSSPPAGWPDNGTAYVIFHARGMVVSRTDNSIFGLQSVDLAEFSTLYAYPTTVRFVGYRQDGTTVTTDFITDGIIGTGGPDFQTFYFPAEFSGLSRVEIPYAGWCLDSLIISVPEPGFPGFLLLAATVLSARAIRKKVSPQL